ncbi:hypothetical protein [Sporosalibacterium faouarense]|uniref:hypothetical protein n=1 Tax=Sporosalibacterium faouarense TaxID=516123 RepID=UPI00192A82DF|nr:hypothetical protein [Sporosalibacterium faouarense]
MTKKEKSLYLLVFVSSCLFILFIAGCEDLGDKKINNSTEIQMGYEKNSLTVSITDEARIRELEDIFNKAEFSKVDTPREEPILYIIFNSEQGTKKFYMNNKNFIRLEDGSYVKSDNISIGKLASIYRKEVEKLAFEKEFSLGEKIENSLKEKIEDSVRVTISQALYSRTAQIINKEEVEKLVDLFSDTQFYKFDKSRYRGNLEVIFYGDNGRTRLYIDNLSFIKLQDGTYVKSKEINYDDIWNIYKENIKHSFSEYVEKGLDHNIINLSEGKIENSHRVVIGYYFARNMRVITLQNEIEDLENLLNNAEFYEVDEPIEQPAADITFYNDKGITRFFIGTNDVILSKDGTYMKSDNITYEKFNINSRSRRDLDE